MSLIQRSRDHFHLFRNNGPQGRDYVPRASHRNDDQVKAVVLRAAFRGKRMDPVRALRMAACGMDDLSGGTSSGPPPAAAKRMTGLKGSGPVGQRCRLPQPPPPPCLRSDGSPGLHGRRSERKDRRGRFHRSQGGKPQKPLASVQMAAISYATFFSVP